MDQGSLVLKCPRCRGPLDRHVAAAGPFFRCAGCAGQAWVVGLLKKAVRPEVVTDLWRLVESEGVPGRLPCPSCEVRMSQVTIDSDAGLVALDACTSCGLIWFDKGEFARLPGGSEAAWEVEGPRPTEAQPVESGEPGAYLQVRSISRDDEYDDSSRPPWEQMAAFLGLPYETETPGLRRRPWITRSLALPFLAWMVAGSIAPAAVAQAGLMVRSPALPPSTSVFASALTGFFALLTLYFLELAGDDAEDRLGPFGYLGLLAASFCAAATMAAVTGVAAGRTWLIVAAGVTGLLVYYGFTFRQNVIGHQFARRSYTVFHYLNPHGADPFRVTVGSWYLPFIWCLGQVLLTYIAEGGHFDWRLLSPHLGGAGTGLTFFALERFLSRGRREV